MARYPSLVAWSALSLLATSARAASDWEQWTCPPPSTVSLSFTEYVPTTTTKSTTIYQTVITTEIVATPTTVVETETTPTTIIETTPTTIVETTPTTMVETTPTTVFETSSVTIYVTSSTTETITETATTTTPVTLTASEELEVYTFTTELTSIVLCPTRITNPTFTAAAPYPTDWTWGCPPGWLCKPLQENCNFEMGLPDPGFYCAPNECEPAEVLPATLPTWDDTIYGNSTPIENPSLTFQTIDDFFNMNPTDFGLTYEIFIVDEEITFTSTIIIPPAPTGVQQRQAQTEVPGACYPWCNNCLLEAQSQGKSPALCEPGSAYEKSLDQCEQCIQAHRDDDAPDSFVSIAPQFQQFIDYCNSYTTVAATTTVVSTTESQSTTVTTLVSTTSPTPVTTTTTPTPSSPTSPSPTSPSETTTETIATFTQLSTSTATLAVAPTTYTGTALSNLTVIVSSSTLSGSALSGATVVLPGTTTETEIPVTNTVITGPSGTTTNSADVTVSLGGQSGSTAGTASASSPSSPIATMSTSTAPSTLSKLQSTHAVTISLILGALLGFIL